MIRNRSARRTNALVAAAGVFVGVVAGGIGGAGASALAAPETAGGIGGVGASALAAPVTATGLIHTCVRPSGVLRLVTDSTSCSVRERSLSWNQLGPAGAPGEIGAAGPAGPTGPAGATGPAAGMASPNGAFRIDIDDSGIFLRGPRSTEINDYFGSRQSNVPFAR